MLNIHNGSFEEDEEVKEEKHRYRQEGKNVSTMNEDIN
jgi:hypothetical protein